jgi:nicotinate-nucleotide adenylyltransferase
MTAYSKTVAILGGSFNPPHEGHFESGMYLHDALGVDEVCLLMSENPFKDPAVYAPLPHRVAMGQLMARHYPDVPFTMSDIEQRKGVHETYLVLKLLQEENPDTRFIWTMGSDCLADFHRWDHADKFIDEFAIAVVNRAGYREAAEASATAINHAARRIENPLDLAKGATGWCFLENSPGLDVSSSALMVDLRNGVRNFGERPFQDVADYIIFNRLYGIGAQIPGARFRL